MKRKFAAIFTALILTLSISVPSFADTADENANAAEIPEAVALVVAETPDCKLINEMNDLSVKISFKDSGRIIAEIPVVKVEEAEEDMLALWLGYEPKEKILEEIKTEMASFQTDFHLGSWQELKKMFESADEKELESYLQEIEGALNKIFDNYTIELAGLPAGEGHKFKTEPANKKSRLN